MSDHVIKRLRIKTPGELRQKAEEIFAKRTAQSGGAPMSEEDVRRLLHELQVHQIELEMQSEASAQAYAELEMQKETLSQAYADLEDSRKKYFSLFNSAPIGYFTLLPDGAILEANRAGADLLGLPVDQLLDRRFQLFVANEQRDDFYKFTRQILQTHERQSCELTLLRQDKPVIKALLTGIALPARHESGAILQIVIIDMSEKKRLMEQHLRTQRMEAIAVLAGGVAHEFNNILTIIINYGQLAKTRLQKNDPARGYLEHVLTASERAATISKGLLSLSRTPPMNLEAVDLNSLIAKTEPLIRVLIKESIELKVVYAKGPLPLMLNYGELEQVLIHLAQNAREAMPDGGRLTIETKTACINDAFIQTYGYGTKGEYALVSVEDTGREIEPELQSKLFEPWLTTKEHRIGLGMGLSIVYGAVKRHGGFINFSSESGKGTKFNIYLPISVGAAEQPAEEHAVLIMPAKGRSEIILFAEDDADILEACKLLLELNGYQVIAAHDGEEAIEKFYANRDKIALVVLDGIMPKKNGIEVYETIKAHTPAIRVIFISGYTQDIFTDITAIKELPFLQKPVLPKDLLFKIREVLNK